MVVRSRCSWSITDGSNGASVRFPYFSPLLVHLRAADLPQQPHYGTIRPFWTAIITIMVLAVCHLDILPVAHYSLSLRFMALDELFHQHNYYHHHQQNTEDVYSISSHFSSSIRFRDRFYSLGLSTDFLNYAKLRVFTA